MRRLPIDTSIISFSVAEEPRQVTDFQTKAPKTNEHGELLYSLSILASAPSEISIISVMVPGPVGQLQVSEPVKLTGLSRKRVDAALAVLLKEQAMLRQQRNGARGAASPWVYYQPV